MLNRELFIAAFVLILMPIGSATADPERSYQAGKELSGQFEGANNVDDRGAGERINDGMRDAGRQLGESMQGGSSEGSESNSGEGGSSNSSDGAEKK